MVAQVLAGSYGNARRIRDLQAIAVPLLLNLEPAAFEETMSILQPADFANGYNDYVSK